MWILFAAPDQHTDSLISEDVLRAATFALCAEWRNGSPTVRTFVRGSFGGTQVASQPLCTPERRREALKQLLGLASWGRTDAATVLAYAHYFGPDDSMTRLESFRWAKISATAESVAGFYLMGLHYLSGQAVPTNDAEALRWFKRAANRDDIRAQFELCLLKHFVGILESYAWCSVAASNPVLGEGANRKRSEAAMLRNDRVLELGSSEELSSGQRIAAKKHAVLEHIRSEQFKALTAASSAADVAP